MENDDLSAYHSTLWKALVYIQTHLDMPLTLEEIAGAAGYSPYHFHRLFRRFTGESVRAYIRRLRLEEAAFRIRVSRSQILDVALDSGYYTHETFSRAFRNRFGENPADYRKRPPEDGSDEFIESVQKVFFSKRKCIFKRHTGRYDTSGMPEDAHSLWRRLIAYLPDKSTSLTSYDLFGISRDDPSITDPAQVRYDACVGVPHDFSAHRLTCIIPGGIYARALHHGPFNELTLSYNYLIYEWCPLYRQRINHHIPPFEQFLIENDANAVRTASIAIYIPLIQ
ncbi:MAG: helix-turn-helix domain-containing protein [Desulfobacteraceae bacterium]|nr:helix-turn-helix domain-containing protein [Desulfobacteraceae bacterium]